MKATDYEEKQPSFKQLYAPLHNCGRVIRRGWGEMPMWSSMKTMMVFLGLVLLAPSAPFTHESQPTCIGISITLPVALRLQRMPCSSSRTRILVRLALRGGYSSAWNSALVHASANGARNDLSLEETCSALKLHGLAVSVSQVQDLLVMSGAAGSERVGEAPFSAALANHPPSSALGRWQQRARFQAACSYAINEASSTPAGSSMRDVKKIDNTSSSSSSSSSLHAPSAAIARTQLKRTGQHEAPKKSAQADPGLAGKPAGWSSLGGDQENLSGEDDTHANSKKKKVGEGMAREGEGSETGAPGVEVGGDGRGTRLSKSRKRAFSATGEDPSNPFAVLEDEGALTCLGWGVQKSGGINAVEEERQQAALMTADAVGAARRDLKDGGGKGGASTREQLRVLRPLMSLSEWNKLSSAKQRKKMRKIAARDQKDELLRSRLLDEANEEENKMQPALTIGSASGRLCMVPTDHRFDTDSAGRGMQLSQGGLVVRKAPGVSTPTYVFFGSALTEGVSRWTLRIDRKRSSFYVGAALLPLEPDEGFAKYLQSSAWMLSDSGTLFQTQQGTARNPLRDRMMPSPDGGHTVEVNVPYLGTATFTAKNKFRKHRYNFNAGSLVKMEMDRDSRTLRFCVDDKQWVTLTGVSNYARPFLNFFTSGDGATILQAEDGRSIPSDLV